MPSCWSKSIVSACPITSDSAAQPTFLLCYDTSKLLACLQYRIAVKMLKGQCQTDLEEDTRGGTPDLYEVLGNNY